MFSLCIRRCVCTKAHRQYTRVTYRVRTDAKAQAAGCGNHSWIPLERSSAWASMQQPCRNLFNICILGLERMKKGRKKKKEREKETENTYSKWHKGHPHRAQQKCVIKAAQETSPYRASFQYSTATVKQIDYRTLSSIDRTYPTTASSSSLRLRPSRP